jgi:hypothetical protein
MKSAELWWSIAQDETRRESDRLEASKLLADRGWGKAAVYEPQEVALGEALALIGGHQRRPALRARALAVPCRFHSASA